MSGWESNAPRISFVWLYNLNRFSLEPWKTILNIPHLRESQPTVKTRQHGADLGGAIGHLAVVILPPAIFLEMLKVVI